MRIRPNLLAWGFGLLLAAGCSKPFTAPPKSVGTVAVLPPSNRTGDPLLIAGGSFLEQYAFETERVTVPDVLLAETRSFLEKRGYTVVPGGTVESATGGQPPANGSDAARAVAGLRAGADGLFLVIRRWEPVDQATPRAVIVSIEATLVASDGRILWQADRPAKPVQTEGAISQGTAYMIAVQRIVQELFQAWGDPRR